MRLSKIIHRLQRRPAEAAPPEPDPRHEAETDAPERGPEDWHSDAVQEFRDLYREDGQA